MKPIVKPDTPLHCQNAECGYVDETWRFSAHGGDDVEYHCPRCKAVADLKPSPTPKQEEQKETPLVMKNKFRDSQSKKPIVGNMPPFLAVDYDNHKVFGPIPAAEIDNVSDDIDLVLPMLDSRGIEELQRRDGKKFEDFRSNVADFVDAIRDGVVPYSEEVIQWLESIGAIEPEAAEDVPIMEVGGDLEERELAPPIAEEYVIGFEDGFGHGYSTGFQRGFQQAMHERMVMEQQEPPPQIEDEDAVETVPLRGSPEPSDADKKRRAQELVNKARKRRKR